MVNNELMRNLNKIHTMELGVERIKKNLGLNTADVVAWCKEKIATADSILRKGKNWYVTSSESIITVNAYSYTIITAHKVKSK